MPFSMASHKSQGLVPEHDVVDMYIVLQGLAAPSIT